MPSQGKRDMLTGDVRALTLAIAGPSVLSMLLQSAGTLADAMLLGRLGVGVTAAVGVCLPLLTLFQTVGFTLGMGAGSFVSRSLGREEREPALRAAACALALATAVSLLLCALGLALTRPLMRLLGADGESLSPASQYARFLLLSAPMLCLSLVLSSLLRALGETLHNLAAFGLSSALGTALCFLLALRLGLGVVGAGVAMLAREALCLLILLRAVFRSPLRPALLKPRPELTSLRDIFSSGLPTLVRQGLMCLCGVLINRIASGFGDAALAGAGLASRILSLFISAAIGFGQGFQPVCGFAYGAGDMERVREAYRFCRRALLAGLSLCGALLFFAAGPLLGLAGQRAEAARFGAAMLRAQAVTLPLAGAVILMNMLTQSMGLTLRACLVASGRQGYVLIPLLLTLPRAFGATGLALAQSAADAISFAIGLALTKNLSDVARADGQDVLMLDERRGQIGVARMRRHG